MKKILLLFTVILFVSCTSTNSKIENAVKELNSNIIRVENIKVSEQYEDSFRSPSDKGTTYKFTATFIYNDGNSKDVRRKIFIADKDGMAKWQ